MRRGSLGWRIIRAHESKEPVLPPPPISPPAQRLVIPQRGQRWGVQARVEDATRQLADKAYGRLRAASAAGDEHATAARRVTDGALSAGWTLPRPRVGPYRKGPASAGPLEWHWSRRKSTECVRPQLAGVNRARNRGLGSRNPPPIIGLRSLQACNGVRQFCTAIPASRCKLAQVRRRLPTGGSWIRTFGPSRESVVVGRGS